jgi:hypothetical protein
MNIKLYNEVEIGNDAYENPSAGGVFDNKIGTILWKGNIEQLRNSKYSLLESDWIDNMDEDEDIDGMFDDYDLVVVDLEGFCGGPTLFNYNNDPCGTVCFK